jgi:signal peptidase I
LKFEFFPRPFIREAKAVLETAVRIERYRRDVADPAELEQLRTTQIVLREAIRSKSESEIKSTQTALLQIIARVQPIRSDRAIRENAELLLVVLVVFLVGLRTYFFGNFEIPTASMQPTLNGIIGHSTEEPPPNLLIRFWDFIVLGRSYENIVCNRETDSIISIEPAQVKLGWRGSRIRMASGDEYSVGIEPRVLSEQLLAPVGQSFKRGEPVVRGYADSGDHLIADKISWNFLPPQRGEVIVFKTNTISGIMRGANGENVFYIKRLAGLPGDTLRIAQPKLFANGKEAEGGGFERVASEVDGYTGYRNDLGGGMKYLKNPETTFEVAKRSYFALGDNSANSFDSRFWGPVPAGNVEGKAAFVYWPLKHFGFVR